MQALHTFGYITLRKRCGLQDARRERKVLQIVDIENIHRHIWVMWKEINETGHDAVDYTIAQFAG